MPRGGAITTLTYYGAEKWMPHYNVMGVAKAALEASALSRRQISPEEHSLRERDLRRAGRRRCRERIGDFRYISPWNEYNTPLRRNVSNEEVGASAPIS